MANDLLTTLDRLGRPRLLVVGDLMLDCYTFGEAERVSPEAPVLVLKAESAEVRLGGAASVAALARGLEAEVLAVGVVGDDPEAGLVRRLMDQAGIGHAGVLCDPSRPTTAKERFLGRAHDRPPHQFLRVDHEWTDPISREMEDRLLEYALGVIPSCQAVLISDYLKGVCTERLCQEVIAAARRCERPVIVDPAKISNWARYRGATLATPNRFEAAHATGLGFATAASAIAAGQELCQKCDLDAVVVTRDRDGMVLAGADGQAESFPAQSRHVADVARAGDMVLATLGVCLASGVLLVDAIRLANVAGGLQVERVGVAPVSRDEIRLELLALGTATEGKIVTLGTAAVLAESCRRCGKRLVFTNGCYDLCHPGHLATLQAASRLGDVLFVGVNSDRSVRLLKGPRRPIVDQNGRAAMLAALECVNYVIVFDESTPHELLRRLKPHVLAKGGTYKPEDVLGREIVEGYGGQVVVTSHVAGLSTTELLQKIARRVGVCEGECVRGCERGREVAICDF